MNEFDDFNNIPVTAEQGLQFQIEDAEIELSKINRENDELKEVIGMKRLTIASIVGFVTIFGFMVNMYSKQMDKSFRDGAFQEKMMSLVEVVKDQGSTIKSGLANQNKLIAETASLKTDNDNTKSKVNRIENKLYLTNGTK